MTRLRQRLITATLTTTALLTLTQPAHAANLLPGGSAITQPAVTTYQHPGELPGLFVATIGKDGFAYYAFNPGPSNPRTWESWFRLGDTRFTGNLAAADRPGLGVEVFGTDRDNRLVHTRVQPGGHAEPWTQLMQGETRFSPTVAYDGTGRPEVFVHGMDDTLFHTGATGDGFHDWRAWTRVPAPQRMHGSPVARFIKRDPSGRTGRPEVYFEGENRQVMRTERTAPGRYAPATVVGHIERPHDGRLGLAPYKDDQGAERAAVMTTTPIGGLATKQIRPAAFDPWFETWGNLSHEGGLSGEKDHLDGAAVMYARFTNLGYYRQRLHHGLTEGWERVGDGEFTAPPTAFHFPIHPNTGKHFVIGRGKNEQIFITGETGIHQRTWSTWHLIGNNV